MSQIRTSNPDGGPAAADRASAAATAAKDQAGSAADAARSQASDIAAAAGEQAHAVAEDAKHQARRIAHDSREHLMSQASEQTTKLAGSVRDVSEQLQGILAGDAPSGMVADLAQQAAGVTARLADQLEARRPDELLDEVRQVARRRPGMFLLGAVGAGFVVGRLARSIDTAGIVDAAKSGAQGDGQDGARSFEGVPNQPLPTASEFPEQLAPAVRP